LEGDGKRKKIKKRKKDPNRPRKPKAPYFFFSQEKNAEFSEKSAPTAVAIGIAWEKISEEKQQFYLDLALKDVERYHQEMATYKSSPSTSPKFSTHQKCTTYSGKKFGKNFRESSLTSSESASGNARERLQYFSSQNTPPKSIQKQFLANSLSEHTATFSENSSEYVKPTPNKENYPKLSEKIEIFLPKLTITKKPEKILRYKSEHFQKKIKKNFQKTKKFSMKKQEISCSGSTSDEKIKLVERKLTPPFNKFSRKKSRAFSGSDSEDTEIEEHPKNLGSFLEVLHHPRIDPQ